MRDRWPFDALALAFTLLPLGACSTQQLGPEDVVIADSQPGPEQGSLVVAYASTAASYQEDQARPANWQPPLYNITMDGKLLAEEEGVAGSTVPQLLPISVSQGGIAGVGYLDASLHHFAVLKPGQAPVFQGDGQVMLDGELRMFVFGAADDQQGRFAFIPATPSTGNESITVINLVRSGQALEVVSCTDASTCAPISPALALGDLFQTEVPALTSADGSSSLTAAGAGIGYRFVPSASLPNPSVVALYVGPLGASNALPGSTALPAPVFIAAPVFMSDQGNILAGFN